MNRLDKLNAIMFDLATIPARSQFEVKVKRVIRDVIRLLKEEIQDEEK